METYCLKCKKHTNSTNAIVSTTKNNRKIEKSKCNQCENTKCRFVSSTVSGGDIVGFLQDKLNPPEMHLPGYNYCGPFTKLEKRLQRGDDPVNQVDAACQRHDIKYYKGYNRKQADQELLEDLDKLENLSTGERVSRAIIKPIIKTKKMFGLGEKKI